MPICVAGIRAVTDSSAALSANADVRVVSGLSPALSATLGAPCYLVLRCRVICWFDCAFVVRDSSATLSAHADGCGTTDSSVMCCC